MKSTYEKPLKGRHMLNAMENAILAHIKTGGPQVEPVTLHIWRTTLEGEFIVEICRNDGTSEFVDFEPTSKPFPISIDYPSNT